MHLRTATLLFALIGAPLLGRADVAPPNQTCTLQNAEDAGASCQECSASYSSDPCATMFAGTGYTLFCKTSGASAWSEIWCAAADGGTATVDAGETPDAWFPVDPVPSKNNCASSVPAVLPLPGLALLLRRRRARRS